MASRPSARVATRVRHNRWVIWRIDNLAAEAVVAVHADLRRLTMWAAESLASSAFLLLCPLLDAVQMKHTEAVPATPCCDSVLDHFETVGTLVLQLRELRSDGLGQTLFIVCGNTAAHSLTVHLGHQCGLGGSSRWCWGARLRTVSAHCFKMAK